METDGITKDWEPSLHLTITPGSNGVTRMAWNGVNRLAVSGRDRAVHLHDFDNSVNATVSTDGKSVSTIKFARKDLLIVAMLEGDVTAFKLSDEFKRGCRPYVSHRHLRAHSAPLFALDVASTGSHFITAGADMTIKMWSVCGQKLVGSFRKHTNTVRQVAYTWDGAQFVSASDDRDMFEWDVRSPNPISSFVSVGGGVSSLAYLPDGHLLAAHKDSSLRVYDSRTKKAIGCYQLYENPIKDLSVHSSGQFAATCSEEDQCSTIVDLINGITLTTFSVKIPVKAAIFLTPSEKPEDDFDTSDFLCLPGRGRNLNIFDTQLTKLVDQEELKVSLSERDSSKENSATENVESKNESTEATDVSKIEAKRASRMSMARKSMMPRKIQIEDIQEETEDSEEASNDYSKKSSASQESGDIIATSLQAISKRMDDMQNGINERLCAIEKRLTTLETKSRFR